MATPRSGAYRSAENLVRRREHRDLSAYLAEHREAGESFGQIATALHHLGIEVTAETVRMWCSALGLHTIHHKKAS